jgi:hypothetical protein
MSHLFYILKGLYSFFKIPREIHIVKKWFDYAVLTKIKPHLKISCSTKAIFLATKVKKFFFFVASITLANTITITIDVRQIYDCCWSPSCYLFSAQSLGLISFLHSWWCFCYSGNKKIASLFCQGENCALNCEQIQYIKSCLFCWNCIYQTSFLKN